MFVPPGVRKFGARHAWIFVSLLFLIALVRLPAFAQSPASDTNQQPPPAAGQQSAPSATPPATQQQPATPPQNAAPQQPAPEVSTQESAPPIRVPSNLVLVRVVVRNSKGEPVGNLKQDDFTILDDKKPVPITHFSADTPESLLAHVIRPDNDGGQAAPFSASAAQAIPSRFVAFLFDDTRLTLDQLMYVRDAADRYVKSAVNPSDRFAIVSISGQYQLDFTDDRGKIHGALMAIQPRAVGALQVGDPQACPPVTFYQAYQAQIMSDPNALNAATLDALACAYNNDQRFVGDAAILAQQALTRTFDAGDNETMYALRRLDEMVRRLSAVPGQRSIVFVSGGFIYPTREEEFASVLDRAAKSNVEISTLDARGLYVVMPGGDVSNPNAGAVTTIGQHALYAVQEQSEQSDVLSELADGTGGGYFRNNNDLFLGFQRLASAPAYSYLLGFTPFKATYDGKYHNIKVSLNIKEKYDVQARRGYFMPKRGSDPAEVAKQEVAEEVFSQEEIHDLPIELHTQFYKVDEANAKLAVMTHVDIGKMRFRKADGRNQNDLTVVAALFDRNGNYITGTTKTVAMKLRDETLARMEQTGINVRTNFDVKPGTYVVRLVARDSEAALMTAANGMVEIP